MMWILGSKCFLTGFFWDSAATFEGVDGYTFLDKEHDSEFQQYLVDSYIVSVYQKSKDSCSRTNYKKNLEQSLGNLFYTVASSFLIFLFSNIISFHFLLPPDIVACSAQPHPPVGCIVDLSLLLWNIISRPVAWQLSGLTKSWIPTVSMSGNTNMSKIPNLLSGLHTHGEVFIIL